MWKWVRKAAYSKRRDSHALCELHVRDFENRNDAIGPREILGKVNKKKVLTYENRALQFHGRLWRDCRLKIPKGPSDMSPVIGSRLRDIAQLVRTRSSKSPR